MKKINRRKGIILITILLILILSTVSIKLFMNDGKIGVSKDSKQEYDMEQEKEKITLSISEAYLAGAGIITEENLQRALENNIGSGKYSIDCSNSEYFKVTQKESAREYKVYTNAKLEGPFGEKTE